MIVHKTLTIAAVALSVAALSASRASADVVYSQTFDDGTVPASITPNGFTSVNVTTDPTTSSPALDSTQAANGGAIWLAGALSAAQTLNDGDSIALSFNLHFVTPSSSLVAGDRKFRFGLYNSLAASGPNPQGYLTRFDVGADAASSTVDLWASAGVLGSSSGTSPTIGKSLGNFTDATYALNDNAVHNMSLLLTRVGNTMSLTVSNGINGGTPLTFSKTDSSSGELANVAYTFDSFEIGQNGGGALEYYVDNLNVTYTAAAVPEPASLGLLGLGGLALLRRRRTA